MGFDLYGVAPSEQERPDFPMNGIDEEKEAYWAWQDGTKGAYFRQNVWGWRPIWEFITAFCDDILTRKDIQMGSVNSGHKISKTKARRIASRINKMNKAGNLKKYIDGRNKLINALPDEKCDICAGTGYRAEPPKTGIGNRKCNGCEGKGEVRPFICNYPSYKEHIIEFSDFCKHSGGFTIC